MPEETAKIEPEETAKIDYRCPHCGYRDTLIDAITVKKPAPAPAPEQQQTEGPPAS